MKMPRLLKLTPLFLGAVVLLALLVYVNIDTGTEQRQRPNRQAPVLTESVVQKPFALVIEALGTANANESVVLTSQETQTVTGVLFEDGDLVEKGQLLLQLNDRAEQARLNEININLAEEKRQLDRIKGLAKSNAASQQLLDEQQAIVKSLKAQQEVAKAVLEELVVRAPFSGKLGVRKVSLGSLIRPGDEITTLDDLTTIKLDFSVSEIHLANLKEGQTVIAKSVAFPNIDFVGSILNIDSRVDPQTRSISVRALIDNKDLMLRPGMLLNINLQKQVLDTLVINESALVPEGDEQYVFVVEEDKAIKRKIEVGERKPGVVQVLNGLQIGEQIIIQGTLKVGNGSSVRVLNKGDA